MNPSTTTLRLCDSTWPEGAPGAPASSGGGSGGVSGGGQIAPTGLADQGDEGGGRRGQARGDSSIPHYRILTCPHWNTDQLIQWSCLIALRGPAAG